MKKERRRLIRFRANENAFVTVGSKYPKIGRIRDISRGGLSFEYHADDGKDKITLEKDTLQASIFVVSSGFSLLDISCMVVYDVVEHITGSMVKKRCGIKFSKFTDEQARQLKNFLISYTKGSVY